MLINTELNLSNIGSAIIPLLFLGIVVTGFAYTMQIYGQKTANPILATMILSCESVFAVIFAYFFLGETLSIKELCGCVILLCAIIISQLPIGKTVKVQKIHVSDIHYP